METFLGILQAAVGVGLLVFLHEAGHFFAARLCGVRVYVFSLGFGPRLFGFVRGGCDYRISLVPVGGYVRMEGEMGEGASVTDFEGSLSHKSPLQRMFVYSGGVAMNFLLAFVLFPVVYYWGVPATRPIVGSVVAGSPAWKVGIRPGSVVRSVNGVAIDSFDQLQVEVALAHAPVRVELLEPVEGSPGDYRPRSYDLETEFDPALAIARLGVEPSRKLVVVATAGGKRLGYEIAVVEGSPAHEAGLRNGDVLLELGGVEVTYGSRGRLAESLDGNAARPVQVRAAPGEPAGRGEALLAALREGIVIVPRVVPGSERPLLGIQPLFGVVKALRDLSSLVALGLRPRDEIMLVAGTPFRRAADLEAALAASPRFEVTVRREGEPIVLEVEVPPAERAEFVTSIAFEEVGSRIVVTPDSPAERAGLQTRDLVRSIDGTEVGDWNSIARAVAASAGKTLSVVVERESGMGTERLTLTATPEPRPIHDTGLRLPEDRVLVRATGFFDAIGLGTRASLRFVKHIAYFLKKIAVGDVPAKDHLGGPISIATQTYQVAQSGVVQLLYFLGILSLNLALINLLPIPVLDGGNLFFVVVEAVKGSPVSDRVLGAAQTVGVFLLIALMVWVTFHDVRKLLGVFT